MLSADYQNNGLEHRHYVFVRSRGAPGQLHAIPGSLSVGGCVIMPHRLMVKKSSVSGSGGEECPYQMVRKIAGNKTLPECGFMEQ